jgi:PPOX class probable F420-dependent enzyme
MPKAPLPAELERFVQAARPAVLGVVRPDGTPVTTPIWYDWEDGLLLTSMSSDGPRLRHVRNDPRVALTILGDSWYDHVSIGGRLVTLRKDAQLVDADRLSIRYKGRPWPHRQDRITTGLIEITVWHTWGNPGASPT